MHLELDAQTLYLEQKLLHPELKQGIRTEVVAMIGDDGYISITGPTEELLDKVANDMVMNGMILTNREVNIIDKGVILLSYNLVGKGNPISLN